ncbi:MAG: CCXG family PEP-CTERM protein [Pseudomonadota bacterium]
MTSFSAVTRFIRIRLFFLFAGAISTALSAFAWDCLSAHRNLVTVTAGAAGHSEEIRIDLSAADFPADYVFTADGADVRVVLASDDTTPVDHIVTGWDAVTRTGTVYIKLPALAPSSSTGVYLYYGDSTLSSLSDVDAVFPVSGLRLRSRVSSVDPVDAASARTAFAAATMDVYDDVRTSVTGLNNQALGGSNGNFGWCISAMVEVTAANAGVWGFRYGADFGYGGHLYVRETELEAQWNDDLWWANNFNNTAETLEGTISLVPGWHRYEALGFEGCCDGPVGWQARAPGGPWQDLSTANFSMRATRCVVTTVTVSTGAAQSCSTEPRASKQVTIASDPFGSASPFAVPGAIVSYELAVTNEGQRLDDGTVVLTDDLPINVKLIVVGANAFEFIDGATPSDLALNWVDAANLSDGVSFSTDGSSFDYVPIPDADGADAAITHVRFALTGAMRQRIDGVSDPSFSISFQAIVE